MGDVIRFPIERRRVAPPPASTPPPEGWHANIQISGSPAPFECTDVVHNFDSVPGRCRCGERYWDPDNPDAS